MAKANLTLPDGTTVKIEGTAEDIAVLLSKFSGPREATSPKPKAKGEKESSKTKAATGKIKRKGPQILIAGLANENYFKSKRKIADVQKKLEESGHIYTIESLSTPLLRLTRKKVLRRLKEKNGWVYVS